MSELRVYNTLSREVETFVPQEPGRVRMYVCGMTVYDYCHIGHARAMMSFDMIYRWLVERGLEVTYVRNHTDVDDKIIERALQVGEDPLALSRRFIQAMEEDLGKLRLVLPQVEPRVSDHIPQIVEMTRKLVERGHAYPDPDGNVWFSVESFDRYGQLSNRRIEDLRAGERVAVDERKRHPGDFALWKAAKEGEVSWESPWGKGRPGWHIECSAMATEYLGPSFDIHGGGIDLVFPHHENEIAQSECANGVQPFSRYWLHNGHLTLVDDDGNPVKMSKSLGNVINIRDLLDEVPPEAVRVLYLGTHYTKPLPFGRTGLEEALMAAERIYLAREVLEAIAAEPVVASPEDLARDLGEDAVALLETARGFNERFSEAMDEDFNSARAIGELFDLVRVVNRFGNHKKWWKRSSSLAREALACFELAGRVLGIGDRPSAAFFQDLTDKLLRKAGLDRDHVQARIRDREQARTTKDWAAADAIRQELDTLGVVLMDSPEGTKWRMRVA